MFHLGYEAYAEISKPLEDQLEIFLHTLKSNPKSVMVHVVFETFWEQLDKAVCQLSSKRDYAFSSSNLCIVDHVIQIINKRVEYWKKVQREHNIPWCIGEEDYEVPEIAAQQVEAILKELIWNLQHFADKLKMDDIAQKELELAQMIGSLLTGQKAEYFKVSNRFCMFCLFPSRFFFFQTCNFEGAITLLAIENCPSSMLKVG